MVRAFTLLASLTCFSPAALAQTWETRALGGTQVHLYAPAASGAFAAGRGLIVGLHGCTQTNTQLRDLGNWEPAAEQFGVVIALPQVPNGGVVAGCWDYYGADHSRTTRHAPAILQTVEALLGDASLRIDRAQVYVAGISSGAGQAAIIACVAPEIFAGVGINAGPAVGTDLSQFSSVSTSAGAAAQTCQTLAGGERDAFATQLGTIIHGTNDFVVAQGYARVDAEALAQIYGAAGVSSFDVGALEGHQPRGTGTLWSDPRGPRVSMIMAQGMGHAFPAGSGPGPERSFIASEGVAWPYYLAQFFTANNRRTGAPSPDAGLVRLDAAMQQKDADVFEPDGGGVEEVPQQGCSCSASSSRGGFWISCLFAAQMSARGWSSRRSRRRTRAVSSRPAPDGAAPRDRCPSRS